jgi:hypothetical protein
MPNVPIQVRLSVAEVSALDSYRRAKSNPPSRARALHELACEALHEKTQTLLMIAKVATRSK